MSLRSRSKINLLLVGLLIGATTPLSPRVLAQGTNIHSDSLILTSRPNNDSVVTTQERALIAIVNLSIQAKKFKPLYRREERRAIKKILKSLGSSYGKIAIHSDSNATKSNFLESISKFENDPSIRVIDTLIYIHGKNETLGFVDTPDYYPSAKLKDDILAIKGEHSDSPKKLRMLYSDACYGALHMRDWVDAGYKVASGAPKDDMNWSTDLKKFMKGWKKGESFSKSIRRANRVLISPFLDLISGGNSYKYVLGDTNYTIDKPVE